MGARSGLYSEGSVAVSSVGSVDSMIRKRASQRIGRRPKFPHRMMGYEVQNGPLAPAEISSEKGTMISPMHIPWCVLAKYIRRSELSPELGKSIMRAKRGALMIFPVAVLPLSTQESRTNSPGSEQRQQSRDLMSTQPVLQQYLLDVSEALQFNLSSVLR